MSLIFIDLFNQTYIFTKPSKYLKFNFINDLYHECILVCNYRGKGCQLSPIIDNGLSMSSLLLYCVYMTVLCYRLQRSMMCCCYGSDMLWFCQVNVTYILCHDNPMSGGNCSRCWYHHQWWICILSVSNNNQEHNNNLIRDKRTPSHANVEHWIYFLGNDTLCFIILNFYAFCKASLWARTEHFKLWKITESCKVEQRILIHFLV